MTNKTNSTTSKTMKNNKTISTLAKDKSELHFLISALYAMGFQCHGYTAEQFIQGGYLHVILESSDNIGGNYSEEYYKARLHGEMLSVAEFLAEAAKRKFPRNEPINHSSYVNTTPGEGNYVLREVQVDQWVATKDRLPTKEDHEPTGSVEVLYSGARYSVTHKRAEDGSKNFTYWRKITLPVEAETPIVVNQGGQEHKVEFLSNGDIKVGCTTVPASTMDKIEEKRKTTKGQ